MFICFLKNGITKSGFSKEFSLQCIFSYLGPNNHGADISVIWLVKRRRISSELFMFLWKANLEVQININANTTMVARFKIRFKSLFFKKKKKKKKKKKRLQWGYSNSLRSVIALCSRKMLLGHIWNEISWWLTSNPMISLKRSD